MMVILNVAVTAFLVGVSCGLLASFLTSRSSRRASESTRDGGLNENRDQQNDAKQIEVERLVRSIYDLTSQVDSQVGQHSQKVNEITNTLNGAEHSGGGSDQILVAGQMLVHANEKLQSDLEEAKKEIQRQREQLSSTIQESQTDPLTGLANRRALDLEMNRVFAQRRRDKTIFSVLIVDIDHFKKINDKYGHMVGDQLLKCFARCLTTTLRETDFVARFGGEEFVVVLKKTPLEDAFRAAERVRSVVAANPHKVGDFEIKVTASFGVKEVGEFDSETEVLQKADEALYAAKKSGRNCCYYHDGETCQQFVCDPLEESNETTVGIDSVSLPANGTVTPTADNLVKPSKKAALSVNVDKHVP